MRHRNESNKYMLMLCGSLIGASVALLLAPQTGAKTRKQLAKYGKKAGNRTQQFIGGIAESLDDVLGDILSYSEHGLEKGKKLTQVARSEILDVLDAGRKYIEEERAKLDRMLK